MKASEKGYPHSKWSFSFGVGIMDYDGLIWINGKNIKSYNAWRNMLQRCYDQSCQRRQPTYVGCKVCEEWLYFSKFKEWFDKNYIDGYQLDKDLIVPNNKVYSPDTCCFLPKEINKIITKERRKSSNLPRNVKRVKDKYVAVFLFRGKKYYCGTFSKIEDAGNAANTKRKELLIKMAKEYLALNKISIEIYKHLITYINRK